MSNNLLKKLNAGQIIYGTCMVSTAPIWSKTLAQSPLDYVFLDTEHIPMDRNELTMLCQVYEAMGLPTIVRIPYPDPFLACMAKDAGATGVLAPYVEDVEQVKQIVGATKYRPLKGKRLNQFLDGTGTLDPEVIRYLQKFNEGSLCLVNIESIPAVENLSSLLDVSGLDAIIIGPHDLSINMGLPEQYEHPEFEKIVRQIIQQAREKGIAVGIHFPGNTDYQIKWIKEGLNIVLHGSDLIMFKQKLNEDITKIKESTGEKIAMSEGADIAI